MSPCCLEKDLLIIWFNSQAADYFLNDFIIHQKSAQKTYHWHPKMSMMTQKRKWRQILQLKDTPVTNMLFLVFAGVSMLMNKVPPPVCVCLTGVLVSQRVCVCVCVCWCCFPLLFQSARCQSCDSSWRQFKKIDSLCTETLNQAIITHSQTHLGRPGFPHHSFRNWGLQY